MSTTSLMKLMFFALALVAVFFPPVVEAECDKIVTGQICVPALFPTDPMIVEYQQPVPLADFTYENTTTEPVTFTIEWAGIDVAGSGIIHSATLEPMTSQSPSGITFEIPDSITEGTHQIAIGVTAQSGSGFITAQRPFELVIVAAGKVREVIQVPVRWCAVEGSPQSQGKLPGQLVDATRLLNLLQQVNNEVWLPQAGILFRHASAPFGIPVIKDPDPTSFDRGDITLTGFGGGEWTTALFECEQAWAELAVKFPDEYGDQRGTVLVNAKTLIPETITTVAGVAPGVPYELWVSSATSGTGRRGDDLCGHPRKLLVSDVTPLLRAVTYDPAIFMAPGFSRYSNETFKPVKVVSHELGHTLTLGHGNGLDDNGDGLAPPAFGIRRFDEYCDPLAELEDATGFVDCDTSSSLMKANTCLNLRPLQREMARAAAKLAPGAVVTDSAADPAARLVASPSACSPTCTTAPSLELRTLELAETPESAVTSFSHSIPEPIPSQASNRYLVYADLDNNAATGCNIAEPGFPAFQGAELRTQVTVSVTGETVTVTPQVSRCNGGAWVDQNDPGIVGSYFVLNAAVHDTTAAPNGAVVTIRLPDAVRGPAETTVRLQALSQGSGQVHLLPSSGAGQTVSLIPPPLPTCSVLPSIARPGQTVVVTANSLPQSQTATLFVGDESTGTASSDASGGLQTNVVVPATSPQGVRSIEARFQGVSAMCSILVQGDAQTPATTASLSPAANSSGWNNSNVTVTLSAVDVPGGPGIRDITYSAAGAQPIALTTHIGSSTQFTISVEGKTIVQYNATNKDGLTEALHTLSISVDKTPPAITFLGNQQTYGILETVQITCSATDALSGVLSSTCKDVQGLAYQFAPSGNTISATTSDFAGNVTTASTSFSLRVTYEDLCTLGQQFLATSTRTPGHANVLGNSMCAHLSSAQAAELRGNSKVKQRSIEAYVHHLMAVSPGILTTDQARILITLARAL